MTPDYQRIAELEYELGFTDEKPPQPPARVQSSFAVDAILKAAYREFPEIGPDETLNRPGRHGAARFSMYAQQDPIFDALVEGDLKRAVARYNAGRPKDE